MKRCVLSFLHRKVRQILKFVFLALALLAVTFIVIFDHHYEKEHELMQAEDLMKAKEESQRINSNQEHELLQAEDLMKAKEESQRINSNQITYNVDLFGPLNPGDPVLIIQIHNRWEYLNLTLESLRKARGISRALIILSHDYYDFFITEIPRRINFCKVAQIFYPYSIQLYPQEFPGTDPKDCPAFMEQHQAIKKGCKNAHHPDSYGHYREAKYCQIKHHWWWKLNYVLDRLNVTKNHDGPFLLLEDDYYVTPDIFHVMEKMEKLHVGRGKSLSISAVANIEMKSNYKGRSSLAQVIPWALSRNNIGFIFTRHILNRIKQCATEFCSYDDYNWDYSLKHVVSKCFPENSRQIFVEATRIIHPKNCGVHSKADDCKKANIDRIRLQMEQSKDYFFPDKMKISSVNTRGITLPKPFGGWGDPRDHELCMSFVTNE